MDRYRAPVANGFQSAMQPEGKKLRRKLQKIGSQQRSSVQFTTSNPKASESQSFFKSVFSSKKAEADRSNSRATLPAPVAIDLSDPKWADYLRTSRYTATDIELVPQPSSPASLSPPADIVPELAHLNLTAGESRKSSETLSTNGPSTPSSASSAASAARRYAKTPVTRIGQLEAVMAHEPALTQNASSIDQIAESYRALLNSRNSFVEERFMTPFQSFDEVPSDLGARAWDVRVATPMRTVLDLHQTPKQDMGSPTSSDGTLVGFEEDAIYFKPISFSPDPPPPQPAAESRADMRNVQSMASIIPENPTVQIIFDLLMQELSAAASGNMMRPGTETSALQIWVMIEAYEKLREKVDDMGLESGQAGAVRAMFGTWLKALHTIHNDMMGNDGQRSESDYGDD